MPLPAQMTPASAHETRTHAPETLFVDVRSPQEFAAGHAPGAVNIPLLFLDPTGRRPNPDFMAACAKALPKSAPIILGCASGGRSGQAQAMLRSEGWTDLSNMIGGFSGGPGMPGWSQCGLPVATDGTTWAAVQATLGGD